MSRCREVVEVIARALADKPEEVRVTEREHRGQTLVELFMAPGDLGRVIGRQGRTAAAMRTLVAAAADLEGTKATLEFRDDQQSAGVMVDPESRDAAADGLLLVGRVARAHGIRGQVIVNPETDFIEDRFRTGRVLLVGPADRTREREILESRIHQGRPIVRFAGIDTMSEAETLTGADLWLRERELEPLPAGTFYRHDLIGCDVVDTHGTVVGRVTGVEGSLDRSYLVVDEHMLIPLVGGICVAVEIARRRVTVDPPEGLIELNRPTGRPR